MGGERASTTRKRERGQVCLNCRKTLDAPPWGFGREMYCDQCAPPRRIYCGFFVGPEGWRVYFLEKDLRTSVGRGRNFGTPEKITEMVKRTPTRMDAAAWQALEHAIQLGRGGLWLDVTQPQYAALWR